MKTAHTHSYSHTHGTHTVIQSVRKTQPSTRSRKQAVTNTHCNTVLTAQVTGKPQQYTIHSHIQHLTETQGHPIPCHNSTVAHLTVTSKAQSYTRYTCNHTVTHPYSQSGKYAVTNTVTAVLSHPQSHKQLTLTHTLRHKATVAHAHSRTVTNTRQAVAQHKTAGATATHASPARFRPSIPDILTSTEGALQGPGSGARAPSPLSVRPPRNSRAKLFHRRSPLPSRGPHIARTNGNEEALGTRWTLGNVVQRRGGRGRLPRTLGDAGC